MSNIYMGDLIMNEDEYNERLRLWILSVEREISIQEAKEFKKKSRA